MYLGGFGVVRFGGKQFTGTVNLIGKILRGSTSSVSRIHNIHYTVWSKPIVSIFVCGLYIQKPFWITVPRFEFCCKNFSIES